MASRTSLKTIIDLEEVVRQEEEEFWPKEYQEDRVLRFGDTERVLFR